MTLEADTETVSEAVFHRKIEFHLARKSFNGFGNINSNNGFKLITLNPKALDSQSESGSSKKAERSELAGIGFDPELSFKITFRRIGAGLRNLGNTCFLNSVLQCLTYTEPLAAYLQSGKHQNSCRTAGFCALCAIQKHVSRALQSSGRILEPKDLVSNLRCISRTFRNARQEDAHEYMVNLLESMHKCCLPSGVPSESATAYDKSLVHKIFGGRLRSQVKCMQCSYCSNKFDPFLDLSLEIVKADSLYKALAHFTAKEQLDGGAKQYQCEQCKQKVKALKQLTIYQAPHVLAIHLKRFGSHVQGQKINKNVYFSPTLDLKPFVTGSYDGELKYTLYGVLVHAGWSTHSGHYYCFVRTSSGMWYSLDDNQVFQVSEKRVLEQKAYMLFYVRDRTSFCAKKPVVNTAHNENIVKNATEKAAYPNSISVLRENAQNGLPKKIFDGPSAALSEKDAPITTVPMEAPSKKPIYTTHKENMVINAIGDVAYPNFKSVLRENVQNGLPEKISKSSSAALSEKDVRTNATPNETPLKKTPSQNITETIAVDHVAPKMDPLSKSSLIVQPMKDLAEGQFSESMNSVGLQVQSSSGADVNSHLKENGVVPMPSSRDNDSANTNLRESADQPSSGKVVNKSSTNTEMCNEGSNKIVFLESSIKSSIEEFQVGHSPTTGDSTIQVNFQASSDVPAPTEGLLHGKSKRKKPTLKVNRKLFKCQIARTQFSSKIIFGAAFGLQKMHMQRKSNSLQKKSPKNLLSGPSDLGSSASCKSLPLPIDECTQSKRKRVECGSDDKSVHNVNDRAVISNDVISDELKRRVQPNGTMVSSVKQPNKMKSVSQETDISEDKRRELKQAGMMSILTRGLEEKTVARWSWDDTDAPLPEKVESREAKNVQIGYIGDEWDEEYDRGKRKKIRDTKISYDGPNPFQVLASSGNKKAKTKSTKLNRSGSKNHPFRLQ